MLPDLSQVILLTISAPELSVQDRDRQLLLIDGTWKYAKVMETFVLKQGLVEKRSLPAHLRTAYPRKQSDCEDPSRGLASIEALFIAHRILKRTVEGLLDRYYWKEAFYKQNHLM